jgi:anti-sigma regulatory factor (Ser/Thr protein kinase)
MVAAIREDLKRKYRVREGIDGLGLALARNLFDRLEALEEPICYI